MNILFIVIFLFFNNIYCNIIHKIEDGDTCDKIIRKYNIMHFDDLYPNINCNNLHEYKELNILPYNSLIISKKAMDDKMEFLVKKYKLNSNIKDNKLKCNKDVNKKYIYNVKKEETCFDIMFKFNLFMETFYEINPYIDCDNLNTGEEINIITDDTFIMSTNYEHNLILNYYLIEKYKLIKSNISNQCENKINKLYLQN